MNGNERIAERAYGLWEREGRPEGRALDHWLSARAEIEDEDGSDGAAPAAVTDMPRPAAGRRTKRPA